MNTPTDHQDIAGIEAYLACEGARIEAVTEEQRQARPEAYARVVERFESVKASRTSATCLECGGKSEYFRLLPTFNRTQEIYRIPTICKPCELERIRAELKRKRMARFFNDNPGARYYSGTSGKPPRPEAYRVVMEWDCEVNPGGLIAIGDSFCGKTTAIVHQCEKLVADDIYDFCRIVSAAELNDIPGMVTDRTLRAFVDDLCEVELLVLDDLDKTRITPRVASELWTIIERRMRANRAPTFITMNVRSRKDFINMFNSKEREGSDPKQIGLSIYNRLVQGCLFVDFNA